MLSSFAAILKEPHAAVPSPEMGDTTPAEKDSRMPLSALPVTVHAVGLTTFRGLPAHILIVHAVVVLVPLAGFALVAAIRPGFALRLGVVLPGLALAAFLSVLAAMNAGGWLQNHVQNTALVRHHTQMAGQLWPFSAAVTLLSVVVWWQRGRSTPDQPAARRDSGRATMTAIIGVLSVLMAVGSIVQVVRIGESGSRAAWQDHFSRTSLGGGR